MLFRKTDKVCWACGLLLLARSLSLSAVITEETATIVIADDEEDDSSEIRVVMIERRSLRELVAKVFEVVEHVVGRQLPLRMSALPLEKEQFNWNTHNSSQRMETRPAHRGRTPATTLARPANNSTVSLN
eukprot:1881546-Rhodomonas_salina.1